MKDKISITRFNTGKKPAVISPDPIFFKCKKCGATIIFLKENKSPDSCQCCGTAMIRLNPETEGPGSETHLPDYSIIGGYDNNVIKVSIGKKLHPMEEEHFIEWIYLRTFTGGQIKYVNNKKQAEVIFALANEDAYVYCDEDLCQGCTFRCKRGFEIYSYCNQHGLWKVEL